jgi:lichenan operon transcriptional antiterminator
MVQLNRRYREIISKLLNAHQCTSVGELALLCNVSIRTIQLDIKKVNSLLKDFDISIIATKRGYYFSEKSKMHIIEKDIIRSCLDFEYISDIPTTPIERQMYILLNLAFNENVELEVLAEQLFVSDATLRNDIKLVQNWLNIKFGINISTSKSKGITLICEENDKRNIAYWIIGEKISVSTITKYWNYIFKETNPSNLFKETYDIVESESKKFRYYLTGNSCMMFSLEILITIRRYKLGFFLESYEGKEVLLPVMESLRREIEVYFNVELPENEWLNLQCYFRSKQFITGTNIKQIETSESVEIVNEFVKEIDQSFSVNVSKHTVVKENLVLYITPMINRLKLNHRIPNPIPYDIIGKFPLESKMASKLSELLDKSLNLNTNLTELAYITLHLVATNELWKQKLNTILVCDFDESVISLIKNKIIKYLGEKLFFYGLYTYAEFIKEKDENIQQIDFIITTSSLADITKIPFYRITPEFDVKYILELEKYIDSIL